MTPSLLPPVYHPLLVAAMYGRDEFQQAQEGLEREAAKDRARAPFLTLDTFIGSHVVDELKELGVHKAELEAIRYSAENIEHGVREVLQGGLIHDLSTRFDILTQPRATPEEVWDWTWKYDGIYIHWGPEPRIPSPFPGVFVEGCYVDGGSSGVGPDAPIDQYFVTVVCGFRDPSQRLELPLVQEYRRYARAFQLLIEANDEAETITHTAEQHLQDDEPCFQQLWGNTAETATDAALAALSFVMSPRAQPASTGISSIVPDLEIDEDLLEAARKEDSCTLWDEYGAVLVMQY